METRGWAIQGVHGLYTGWCHTRVDAIAQHAAAFNYAVSGFASGGKLDQSQRAVWNQRRKKGDRAVKITIQTNS